MAELDGKQVGTLQQDAVNKTGHQNTQSHNMFDLSHYNALTARFGELTPFLCKEVVPGDNVRFGSNHELRTLTLAAPVLSPVRMHKDYFFVPMKSILPHWDEIISNEIRNIPAFEGQDLSVHLPRINIYKFYREVAITCQGICDYIKNTSNTIKSVPIRFYQFLAFARNVFSQGSILRLLQYPSYYEGRYLTSQGDFYDKTAEELIDMFFTRLFDKDVYVDTSETPTVWSYGFGCKITSSAHPDAALSFRCTSGGLPKFGSGITIAHFLDILNTYNTASSDLSFDVTTYSDNLKFPAAIVNLCSAMRTVFGTIASAAYQNSEKTYEQQPSAYVNPSKLAAYHAIAVQFFTNDKVDDITNVRQWLRSYFGSAYTNKSVTDVEDVSFVSDGFTGQAFLAFMFAIEKSTFTDLTGTVWNEGYARNFYMLLRLMQFNNSLKYGDYFIGSRPKPISNGDVSITVSGGAVQAIDVTKNLLVQKLLNAVNKLGASISEYSKGIMGQAPRFVDATPQFLARSTTYIGNPETINTADDQGRITSQFRSVDGKFEFSASFDDFGYIVGLVSFDVLPCYPFRTDRDCYHTDFYTFFNPMLQNIGDQPVELQELSNDYLKVGSRFAYQQRYAEYKSMASYCTGAFAQPRRSLVFDGMTTWLYQTPDIDSPIDPYIIRHHAQDFDRFYSAFDGLELSKYCHFAIIFNNDLKINRKMQFQSTLL